MFINKFFGTKSFSIVAPFFLACLVILPTLEQSIRPILGSSFTRLDLLAYTWDFPQSVILAILATAFMATLFGSYILLKTVGKPKIFLGMTLLSLGLSLPHVVVSPPFEAPDEPDHFRGLIRDLPNPAELEKSAAELSRQGQFPRIYTTWDAKLQPEDLLRKSSVPWIDHMEASVMKARSPFVSSIWTCLQAMVQFQEANHLLLAIRMLQCILFCVVVGGFSAVAAALMLVDDGGLILGTSLLMIPALPFFAAHVSNYGLLTSLYILGCLIVPLSVRLGEEKIGSSQRLFAFMFGFFAVLPTVGAASAVTFVAIPLSLAGGILFSNHAKSIKDRVLLGVMMLLGALSLSVAALPNLTHLPSPIEGLVGSLPAQLIGSWASTISSICLVIIITILLWVGNVAAEKGLNQDSESSARHSRLGPRLLFIGTAIMCLWPVLLPPAIQPNIEIHHQMTSDLYIRSSIKKYFLNYASLHSDLYLCSSFWLGFGWLEMPVQRSFLMMPKILAPLMLLLGSWQNMRPLKRGWIGRQMSSASVMASIFGIAIAIAWLAYGSFAGSFNLHGRYLMGVEILFLVTAGTYYAKSRQMSFRSSSKLAIIFTVCMVKGFTLVFLLNRYF